MKAGHYFAFVKDHVNKKWYKMDDETVTLTDYETVVSESQGKGK